MEALFIYFGKMIFVSGVFWVYYKLFLDGKEFHHYNRFFLLSAALLSIFLPLIKVNWFTIEPNSPQITQLIIFLNSGPQESFSAPAIHGPSLNDLMVWLIAAVSVLLLLKFLFSVIKILRLKHRYPNEKFSEYNLVMTDLEFAPFTFLKNLFWNQQLDLHTRQGEKIFLHELAHITQGHTVDRILLQIIKAIFWFNPFNYLFHREIILLHEYLADEQAIADKDSSAFAEMLLSQQIYQTQLTGISPFFSSTIKKRLNMLTKKHNTKFSYARRIWALPLLFIFAFAFMVQAKNQEIKAQIENSETTAGIHQVVPSDTIKGKLKKQQALLERQQAVLKQHAEEIARKNASLEKDRQEIEQLSREIENKSREIEKLMKKTETKARDAETNAKIEEIQKLNEAVQQKVTALNKNQLFMLNQFPEISTDFFLDSEAIKAIQENSTKMSEFFNSNEWKGYQELLNSNAEKFSEYFNSPEWKEQIIDPESLKEVPYFQDFPEFPDFNPFEQQVPNPPTPPTRPATTQLGKGKVKLHFNPNAEYALQHDGKGNITTRLNPEELTIYINGKKSTKQELEKIDGNRIKSISLDTNVKNDQRKGVIKIKTD